MKVSTPILSLALVGFLTGLSARLMPNSSFQLAPMPAPTIESFNSLAVEGSNLAQSISSLKSGTLFSGSTTMELERPATLESVPNGSNEDEIFSFDYQLVGITQSSGRHHVHLKNMNTPESMTVMFRDVVQGWTLSRIDKTSVDFTQNDHTITLSLFSSNNPTAEN